MKKKRHLMLLCAALMLTAVASAAPVGPDRARAVGAAFLRSAGHPQADRLREVATPFSGLHLLAAEGGGFVVVAADDAVRPILGYSLSAPVSASGMPAHVRGWLQAYDDEVRRVVARQADLAKQHAGVGSRATEAVARQWRLLAEGVAPAPTLATAVAPLLATTWNQSPLYNDLCPYDEEHGERVVTGCVATATAQVMKFWNHPATGYGSHTYHATNSHADYGQLSANFGATTYQWGLMPPALTSVSSQAEVEAVATLMYHIGVADEMSYDVSSNGGSGAQNYSYLGGVEAACSQNSLIAYFKYRPDMAPVGRDDDADSTFCALLRGELDLGRPILYSGSNTSAGHSFVVDGYDDNGLFHLNWGWGGYLDGYFYIGSLNPGVGGIGGNSSGTYNLNNVALLGVRPNTEWGTGGSVAVTVSGCPSCSVSGGGTYSFGDTVSLVASAPEGYRFAGWSDHSRYTPRLFVMTGGDIQLTARFESLASLGDTVGYCSNRYITSFGTGQDDADARWGIRLPAASIADAGSLTAVQFYAPSAGTYDLAVLTGTTAPSDTVFSTSVTVPDGTDAGWHTAFLDQPLALDGSRSVWVALHNIGLPYPAAVSYGSGNEDGFLWGDDLQFGGWNQCSFMVRALFNASPAYADGDTLSFCGSGNIIFSWGYYTPDFRWGIRLPAATLAGRSYLKGAMLFVDFTGQYNLHVYRGGDGAPGTLVHSQVVNGNTWGWTEVLLDTVLPILPGEDLWLVFSAPDLRWPAAVCGYSGMADGDWATSDGTNWFHMHDEGNPYSWLVKAITSDVAPTLPPPTVMITRQHYTTVGTATTFAAQASPGATVAWSFEGGSPASATGPSGTTTWAATGSYMVRATATSPHGTGADSLWVEVVDCGSVQGLNYSMGFECWDNLLCLELEDGNSDSLGWEVYQWNSASGQRSMLCTAEGTPDDWLRLPKLYAAANEAVSVRWYDNGPESAHYGLYIDTTLATDGSGYTLLGAYNCLGWWEQRQVDLSAYAGQVFRLAFRFDGGEWVMLDDILVARNLYVEGDTLSYCSVHGPMSTLGNGGTMQWGIRIPAQHLDVHNSLAAVQLYVAEEGSYTLSIAQGGDEAPGQPLYTRSYDLAGTGWHTLLLDSTLYPNPALPLWITFASPVAYPACYTWDDCDPVTGIRESDWTSADNGSTWTHATQWGFYVSWMIRAVMPHGQPQVAPPTVSLTGPSQLALYAEGLFEAAATAGAYLEWEAPGACSAYTSGNTLAASWASAGTYLVRVRATTAGGSAEDSLQVSVVDPYTIHVECLGGGSGWVVADGAYTASLCGMDYASYEAEHQFMFYPDGSRLASILVDGVERLPAGVQPTEPFELTVNLSTASLLQATFEPIPAEPTYYAVQVLYDPTMGSVSGSDLYEEGSRVELRAYPAEGHRFLCWRENGTEVGSDPLFVIGSLASDRTLTALFQSTEGIAGAEPDGVEVQVRGLTVGVSGAEGRRVALYDLEGRQLHLCELVPGRLTVEVPAAGVYLLQVGQGAARRVVVMP